MLADWFSGFFKQTLDQKKQAKTKTRAITKLTTTKLKATAIKTTKNKFKVTHFTCFYELQKL